MKRSRPTRTLIAPALAVFLSLGLMACQGRGALAGHGPAAESSAESPASKDSDQQAKNSAQAGQGSTPKAKKPAPKKPAQKKPSVKDLEGQVSKLKEEKVEQRRKLAYAEAELQIAELGASMDQSEADDAIRQAREALEEARQAMELFDGVERPIEVAKGELRLKNAEHQLLSAETDLAGLEEIFEQEVEASAKPEILRRGRHDVERAREQLELARAEVALETGPQLAARMRELAGSVRSAEAALGQAKVKARKVRMEGSLAVEKATDERNDQRRASKRADNRVESRERQLNKAREAAKARSEKNKKESAGPDGPEGQ